jgi:hypothetical protein
MCPRGNLAGACAYGALCLEQLAIPFSNSNHNPTHKNYVNPRTTGQTALLVWFN